jgi:hypothetical protein
MKHTCWALLFYLLGSIQAQAQISTGCKIPKQDRTVAFCAPVEGATITDNEGTEPFAIIRDSLPHTAVIYVDGNPNGSGVFERGISSDIPGVSFIDTGRFVIKGLGWHTITLAVFDAKGSFRETVRFRLSGDPQCPKPTTDKTIKVCSPIEGRVLTSPVHFSIVSNSSVPIRATEVFVDRGIFGSLSYRAPAGGFDNNLPNQRGNTFSMFLPIPAGTRSATIKVIQTDNHTFEKKITLNVVEFEECCK